MKSSTVDKEEFHSSAPDVRKVNARLIGQNLRDIISGKDGFHRKEKNKLWAISVMRA